MPIEAKHIAPHVKPYACKNRVHPNDARGGYLAQDGVETKYMQDEDGEHFVMLVPAYVLIETQWADTVCGHTARKKDPRCKGCKWRRK